MYWCFGTRKGQCGNPDLFLGLGRMETRESVVEIGTKYASVATLMLVQSCFVSFVLGLNH